MSLEFLEQEPLSKHTSFAIGGPAWFFVRIKNIDDIPELIDWMCAHPMPCYLLGAGSNTLASDEGFAGLVIKMEDRRFTIEGTRVVACAGAITAVVSHAVTKAGLTGMEWAFGVPGTVGGAVRGNAGAFGGSYSGVLESVEWYDLSSGERKISPPCDLGFRYRWSNFAIHRAIISRATLVLQLSDPMECEKKLQDFLKKKKELQPLGERCAGSVFKNVAVASLDPRTIPEEFSGKEIISVGWLLDRAGMKGERAGKAAVSEKHANFITNTGGATSSEVIELITRAKQRVRDMFGIMIEEEIRHLGPHTTY